MDDATQAIHDPLAQIPNLLDDPSISLSIPNLINRQLYVGSYCSKGVAATIR